MSELQKAIAVSRVGNAFAFTNLDAKTVFSERLVVFAALGNPSLAVLQSRIHECWARLFGSSLKDDLMYAPSDCFEIFPFPPGYESHPLLEAGGLVYSEFRAALMVRRDEGLTQTYNRFHDPGEMSDDVAELRRLHNAMDRAVLNAYGWTNLQPVCDVFPEFDDEAEDDEESTRKKKRFRYRWPDELRDDVLARLLVLNSGMRKRSWQASRQT